MTPRESFLVLFLAIVMSRFLEHVVMGTLRAWSMRRFMSKIGPGGIDYERVLKGEIRSRVFTPAELAQSRAGVRHHLDEQAYVDGWRAAEECNGIKPSGGGLGDDPDSPENDHIMHHYMWDGTDRSCKNGYDQTCKGGQRDDHGA